MSQKTDYFPLRGGLDLVTPAISVPPGRARAAVNHEPDRRGYRRIDGFERCDGRPKPSAASYWVLAFESGAAAIGQGDVVVGATSNTSGKVLVAPVISSGAYGSGDAAGYVVLTAVSGIFQVGENLQVGGATKATAAGLATERGAEDDNLDSEWRVGAIEAARALIGKVPGSGPVRGVWVFDGDVWAVRDNAGGTAAALHKATAAGWVAQSLGYRVAFTGGTSTGIAVGDTVTGATSGASAVATAVAVRSGDWSSNNAVGTVTFAAIAGVPFQNGENLRVGGVTKAVASGASAANALPAGGRYDVLVHNFFGSSDMAACYGANGVGPAFSWDGSVFVPLLTGMASDAPQHVGVHRNHLFLSYAGGSMQHSGVGDPYSWTVRSGAAEIGIGEDITALLGSTMGEMTVFGRNKIAILYGDDSSNWVLKFLNAAAGAVEWTVQQMAAPVYLDDAGLRDLRASQAYGDFSMGTLSALVEPLFRSKAKAGVRAVASARLRGKDQYRLFFADGSGLAVRMGGKDTESLPIDYDGTILSCVGAGEIDSREVVFFGAEDGFVYQMDSGTSFDGRQVEAYLRLGYNHFGSPTREKRFHLATMEITAGPSNAITVGADFSYGSADRPSLAEQPFTLTGSGGNWNEANWNEFSWSASVEGLAQASLDGIGTNIALLLASRTAIDEPYVIHGVTVHYSPRRQVR